MHNCKTQAHDVCVSTHKQTQMQKDRNRNSSDRHADTLTYQKTHANMQTHADMQTQANIGTDRHTGMQFCRHTGMQTTSQKHVA